MTSNGSTRLTPTSLPRTSAIGPVFDGDATVYVDIGRRYTTTEALKKNASVAVLIDEYDDDWNRLRAVLPEAAIRRQPPKTALQLLPAADVRQAARLVLQ